jgi:hypothetical protein
MDKKIGSLSSPKNKNRGRFYSHQIDGEHFKALGQLREVNNEYKDISECKADSENSTGSQKVAKDPSELLDGISDMFVNSELGISYAKVGQGKCEFKTMDSYLLSPD